MLIRALMGKRAERLALHYLKQQGLTFIAKNFTCAMGEIDLIMQDQHSLVFIEVRLRHRDDFATGLVSVNQTKQRKIIKTALFYLQSYPLPPDKTCRFDVIGLSSLSLKDLTWVKNAFTVEGNHLWT